MSYSEHETAMSGRQSRDRFLAYARRLAILLTDNFFPCLRFRSHFDLALFLIDRRLISAEPPPTSFQKTNHQ